MPTILSPFAKFEQPVNASDRRGQPVVNRFFVDLKAADLVANNIIDIGILPAGHSIVSAVLIADDLDTNGTPTLTLDVGILSGTIGDAVSARTCGTELFAASNAAQTGATVSATSKTAFTIVASPENRSIGARVVTGAATGAAGRLRLLVTSAPVSSGFVY